MVVFHSHVSLPGDMPNTTSKCCRRLQEWMASSSVISTVPKPEWRVFLGAHGSQTFYQTPHLHLLEQDELAEPVFLELSVIPCDSCMFDLFYMAGIYQIIPTCNLLDAKCWISPDEWFNGILSKIWRFMVGELRVVRPTQQTPS